MNRQHPLDRKLVERRAPRWLIEGKRKMVQSEKWATMTDAVQEEMARLLKQNRVRYFSDLNADEIGNQLCATIDLLGQVFNKITW